ncbi:DsrE family protein [uncultured Secundilactobacillus sp.]|uniref:DsrE family protein n=1 Tax=uncultured Secundilactobacillus sp. TaxID=2813935 RepID=UPI0025855ABD|nr:DsrE family protein [uncultured Secundilactobacillus sp.]
MEIKILIHVDQLDRISEMTSNLTNLLNYRTNHPDDHLAVIVVLNGDAIMATLMPSFRQRVTAFLHAPDVAFHACNNSLNSHGTNPGQLQSGVEVVEAGVVDLAIRQDRGFRYIKP